MAQRTAIEELTALTNDSKVAALAYYKFWREMTSRADIKRDYAVGFGAVSLAAVFGTIAAATTTFMAPLCGAAVAFSGATLYFSTAAKRDEACASAAYDHGDAMTPVAQFAEEALDKVAESKVPHSRSALEGTITDLRGRYNKIIQASDKIPCYIRQYYESEAYDMLSSTIQCRNERTLRFLYPATKE